MERERFEQLIIDYIEGNLNRQEEDEFLSALTEHEEYREIYDQYVSIHNIMEKEDDISPSEAVLNSISEYARHSAKTENPSILKKWFSLPILAPLLGTAVVAMFWFSVGDQYLKDRDILKVAEVRESRNESVSYDAQIIDSANANEPLLAEEQVPDLEEDNLNSDISEEFDIAASTASSESDKAQVAEGYRDNSQGALMDQEDILRDRKGKRSLVKSPEAPRAEDAENIAGRQTGQELRAGLKADSESENVAEKSAAPSPEKISAKKEDADARLAKVENNTSQVTPSEVKEESKSPFREQINNVLTQQYQGDCLSSIQTSNQILNSQPEPPKEVKTTLYLSQAECYEELNQIDDAINAYEKVQEIEPSSNAFFSTKIRQLNMKKVK